MRVLLLAGTSEARQLAAALKHVDGLSMTASLAAGRRAPAALGVATRIGGFGGDAGFEQYLLRERIGAVLDATHPFSAGISHRSARICRARGVAYAQLLRPSWRPGAGDAWFFAENEASAAAQVPEGARVFIATGQQRLEAFGRMPGRRVYVRQIDRSPAASPPFADGHWLVGTPPFSTAEETALFRGLAIDWLIARNAGGSSSRAKLDAARVLGIDVAMIRRPLQPEAIRLDSVTAALAWVRKLG
jgi:precorrin-6A/cobalt-precorrin-6A reductase